MELPDRVPSLAVRVTADPSRFRDVLLAERPRLVVCSQPPADAEDLDLVVVGTAPTVCDARSAPVAP